MHLGQHATGFQGLVSEVSGRWPMQEAQFVGDAGHDAAENVLLSCSIYEFHVSVTIPWYPSFRLKSLID